MPFVDQKEKRASVLDEPYAAGIILTLRDKDLAGEAPLTLSGVKHTVSANYNSVKRLLIWMEDMGIIDINKSVSSEHLRPGRPGHNVELTEKGKNIADSLNAVVLEIGEVPNYRKNAKGKAKAPKAAAKTAAKPAAKASKPVAKVSKPAPKEKAPKAAAKTAAKPAAKASKPVAKTAAKKAPAKKTSSRKVKK